MGCYRGEVVGKGYVVGRVVMSSTKYTPPPMAVRPYTGYWPPHPLTLYCCSPCVHQTVDFGATALAIDPTRATIMDYHVLFVAAHNSLYKAPVVEPDLLGFVKPFTLSVRASRSRAIRV